MSNIFRPQFPVLDEALLRQYTTALGATLSPPTKDNDDNQDDLEDDDREYDDEDVDEDEIEPPDAQSGPTRR